MTRYSIFSYVVDRSADKSVPVGVVVWSHEQGWHQTRFLQSNEHLLGVNPDDYMPYLELVAEKIQHWVEDGKLPYAEAGMRPFDDEWWLHVRKLLVHEIRLSEPTEVPQPFSRDSVEALFLSVVAPSLPAEEQHSYLDRLLLNSLRDRYHGMHRFPWRGETGGGCWQTTGRTVTLNLLNLAVPRSGHHTLALPERETPCATAEPKKRVMLVCYLPPPSGVSRGGVLQALSELSHGLHVCYFDLFAGGSELRRIVEELVESE
jgi:hypothetical protein